MGINIDVEIYFQRVNILPDRYEEVVIVYQMA